MPAVGSVRVVVAVAAVALCACSAGQHGLAADRAAKQALAARRVHVPEVFGSMDVDRADERARPARTLAEVTLDLEGALCLAAEASREFRERRERAYLAAVSYVSARHEFRGRPTLGGSVALEASEDSSTLTGGPRAGLSRAFETGGSFVLDLATDFLRTFRGDPLGTAATLLSTRLLLPLGRGQGVAARESLTQAERDVLYALRDYARFQQEFAVDVATSYYGVLQQRDVIANAEANWRSLQTTFDRARDMGPDGAGRLPGFQVDQAGQDLLRAEERRIAARQAYEEALDAFKQELGLLVTTRVVLPDDALDELRAQEAEAASGDPARSAVAALGRRLDLANARDRLQDATRKVAVAADALGVQADLELAGALETPGDRPVDVGSASPSGSVGLDLDLPVDRVVEANAYRSAQVAVLAARRDVERLEDAVVASVRRAYRTLEQARQSRRIQEEGVRLAERRVEAATLNLEMGTATIRDRLEAEDALIEARDALTRAIVDHEVARLELERDTGTLLPSRMLACEAGACAPSAAAPPARATAPGAATGAPVPAPTSPAPASSAPPADRLPRD
jgi:outer membrane protein TolC